MTGPQHSNFRVGGSQTLKALWVLNRYIDAGPSISFMALPSRGPDAEAGTAWTLGGSLRLKRPFDSLDDTSVLAVSPWVDVDALAVRTGDLFRPGFAAAAGLAFPIGKSRSFWIGPFIRYFQIISTSREGFDTDDANILNVGISVELGAGITRRQQTHSAHEGLRVAANTETAETVVVGDRDGDGINDDVDHCADVAGPAESFGCPQYAKVIVKRDKLELKEKLYFKWNEATLEPASFPLLDDVVQALKDNKNFRVQVEGHSSSDGNEDRNQTLSNERAQTVLNYLVEHGVGKDRLISKGFSSSVPADTNTTEEGRENNRRVEFVVNFIIVTSGSN